MAIKFNIKNIFMFSVIYTSVYLFLMSFFGNSTNIINKANFSFLNYTNVLNQCIAVLGGSGSFVFKLFFTTVNFTWLQYIFAYIMSPFFFLADFLLNIVYLIVYEITVIQYPLSSLPFGIGNFLSGIFYLMIVIIVITSVRVLSSGINGSD